VLCAALASFALVAGLAACQRSLTRGLWMYALAPVPALFLAAWIVPPDSSSRTPLAFIERQVAGVEPGALLVSDSRSLYSVNLAFGRDDVLMLWAGELEYGLGYPDSRDRLIRSVGLRQLVVDPAREHDIALVTEEPLYDSLLRRGLLPRADVAERGQDLLFAIYRKPAAVRPGAP
jgi:4-amino-4-deoxy-L-arabinose transferase